MKRFPLVNLSPVLHNGQLVVSVSEATDSKCNGTLKVVINDHINGQPTVLTKKVSGLGAVSQDISLAVSLTSQMHPVTAELTLVSGEVSVPDQRLIQLQ